MTPLYIKQSSLALKMNRTNRKPTEHPKSKHLKSEHFFVRFVKPNVRFLALYCTLLKQSKLLCKNYGGRGNWPQVNFSKMCHQAEIIEILL